MGAKPISKRTILYTTHKSLNASMDSFGGFLMPMEYSGVLTEYRAARESASLFDTCHMGKIRISGENACSDLENILTCSVGDLNIGQCRYGFICNEDGKIFDDQVIFRIAENKYILVVNALAQRTVLRWVEKHSSDTSTVTDISDITAKIDVQGPSTPGILSKLLDEPITDLAHFHFTYQYYKHTKLLVSRSGFTGEIGFEIFCPLDVATTFWYDCMVKGAVPAGLFCRDILRLEMGYPRHGRELTSDRNPAETGGLWAVKKDKPFIGSDRIPDPAQAAFHLTGFILDGEQTAGNGDRITTGKNTPVGIVTSSCISPALEKSIALGYLEKKYTAPGTKVTINATQRQIKATVSEIPFYKNATGKKKLSSFF